MEDAAYEKCKQMDLRRSRVRGTSVLGPGVRVERTVRADRRRVPPLDHRTAFPDLYDRDELFCLGGLTCGALSARISPRIFLWISALLFLAGFLLTASMRSLPMLYVGFGVVCGLASGFSYNAVLGTVGAWFPDKQGLVSGILLMGFGLSSFLIGKLYQRFTPTAIGSWRRSFVVLGIITAVLVAACGFLLRRPGTDFTPPPAAKKKHYAEPRGRRARHGGHAAAARVLAVLSLGGTPERGRAGPRVAVHLHRAGDRQNGLAGRYHHGRRHDLAGERGRARRAGRVVRPTGAQPDHAARGRHFPAHRPCAHRRAEARQLPAAHRRLPAGRHGLRRRHARQRSLCQLVLRHAALRREPLRRGDEPAVRLVRQHDRGRAV